MNEKTIKQAWENVYNEHGQNVQWSTQERANIVVKLVADYIQENNRQINSLLDYGAGTGHISVALKNAFNIPNVVAVDIAENSFDKEALTRNGIKHIAASLPKDKIDGKFDLILCWSVLYHDHKLLEQTISEFSKLLTQKGNILIGLFDQFKENEIDPYSLLPMEAIKPIEISKLSNVANLSIAKRGKLNISLGKKVSEVSTPSRLLRYYFIEKQKEQTNEKQ